MQQVYNLLIKGWVTVSMKSNKFVTCNSPKDSYPKFLKVTQTYCQVMYKLHIAGSSQIKVVILQAAKLLHSYKALIVLGIDIVIHCIAMT